VLLLANSVEAADSITTEPSKDAASENSKSKKALSVPKGVAGVIAGLTIGVPIKISKDVRHETRRIAGTIRGDVGNDFGVVENVIVAGGSIPFGIIGGTILGTIRGTEHAITYGSHQPFSKESLSLKEPAQEPDKQISSSH
jgi:hypothetical protein